jgi:hypothetical protein
LHHRRGALKFTQELKILLSLLLRKKSPGLVICSLSNVSKLFWEEKGESTLANKYLTPGER